MNLADFQREHQACYVVSARSEYEATDFRAIAAGNDDGPRIVDPVTFYDAARKVLGERANLLHRLAK